jgi:hypothetical protein
VKTLPSMLTPVVASRSGENPDDPNEPGDEECMIYSADGRHRLLFIEVPEGKFGEARTAR